MEVRVSPFGERRQRGYRASALSDGSNRWSGLRGMMAVFGGCNRCGGVARPQAAQTHARTGGKGCEDDNGENSLHGYPEYNCQCRTS